VEEGATVSEQGHTSLERQIRSQPAELERLLTDGHVRQQVHAAAEGLHRVRRIWLVGTGSSQHVAHLGAAMLQDAGRSAHAVSSMQFVRNAPIVGPHDGVVLVTHSGESAYALAARSLAFGAGLQTVTITRRGTPLNDAIETVDEETSQTHSVAYTSALLVMGLLAAEMGADATTASALSAVPAAVTAALADTGTQGVVDPPRALVFVGAGPSAVTADEGAVKVREAARILGEGYDAEYLLHGNAVPLGSQDHLVALVTPDEDGLVEGLAKAAEGAGVGVTRVAETSGLPPLLLQIPYAVRMQVLALRLALARRQDPDKVITGTWDDPGLWAIGSPVPGD
jgi:glucosamine--fructose-6-phosphate aminotransferase (isomerizing)